MLSILLFAFMVSLDSLVTGFSYGFGGIKLPLRSRIAIAAAVGASLALSMSIGSVFAALGKSLILNIFAIFLVFLMSFLLFWKNYRTNKKEKAEPRAEEVEGLIFSLELPSVGLILQLLREPNAADSNKDLSVSGMEALFLGIALSLDSFAAGFAFALSGYSIGLTVIASMLFSLLLLTCGLFAGKRAGSSLAAKVPFLQKFTAFIPSIILFILGLWRLGGLFS